VLIVLVFIAALICPSVVSAAQDPPPQEHHHETEPATPAWMWMTDAACFLATTINTASSPTSLRGNRRNWFMLDGSRTVGPGTLTLASMISLEPFTLKAIGSPQVVSDRRDVRESAAHRLPASHDLFMQLGVSYRVQRDAVGYFGRRVPVGPARARADGIHATARRHATTHKRRSSITTYTDSTHITPGVVTGGVDAAGFTVEASWFNGHQPDEDRDAIDRPSLNSWSARASWHRGPWRAQFSGRSSSPA